jgi:hypothetical protein
VTDSGAYVDPKLIEPAVLARAADYAQQHSWDLRQVSQQPKPPYPAQDNPMLEYLLKGAIAMWNDGADPMAVIAQAVVHAWYEGHIEGLEAAQS